MSSRQCLGGGGSSSGASVSLISSPQRLQRYLTFTLRSSPAGGGVVTGALKLFSRPTPLFHRTNPIPTPNATQMMVESAGMNLRLSLRSSGREGIIGLDPSKSVGGRDAPFADLVEHRPDAG